MAYNRLDPIGNERLDVLFARLTFFVVQALHPKATDLKVEDFMPEFSPVPEEEPERDPQAMRNKLLFMNARLGGKQRKHGDPS